jgi:hypothetical protein
MALANIKLGLVSLAGLRTKKNSMIVQKMAGQKASFKCSQTLSLTAEITPNGLQSPEKSKVK